MHLTNYSVNKHNEYYERNMATDTGSKRSIRYFNEYLRQNDIDVALLWRNIADMITKVSYKKRAIPFTDGQKSQKNSNLVWKSSTYVAREFYKRKAIWFENIAPMWQGILSQQRH